MACQGYGNISREEKEEYLRKKMEDMKKKSEEILRRHAEVEADKRNADMLSNMISTKTQANTNSQATNVVKNVKNASHVQREKSLDHLIPEKSVTSHHVEKQWSNQKASEGNVHPAERMRSSWQVSEENTHFTERPRISRQRSEENVPSRRKDADYRKQKLSEDADYRKQKHSEDADYRKQKHSEDDGPPPDPINYLSDPYRDGSFPDVERNQERNQDSRRHRSNYGGENFHNVKPIMQQKRSYERQHPPPPPSNSNLSMSIQMTGKERKEYENWKAERNKIDEERIARQKTSMGTWKREWDLNKNEHEEAAKKSDKQFYKQPRWISESGDQQQNEKKSQGNRGHFNPSFDHRFDEKCDRSVVVNEHNTLTIVKSSEFEDDSVPQSQYQRNQGGKRVFERKQNASVSEGKIFYLKKDANGKQNDRMSTTLKGDGWEDAGVTIDGTKWDDDVSSKKDVYPLQQSNNPDREWRTGTKFNQRKNDVDNKYNKGNPNIDFYDKSHKRQNSVNFEDFHDEMTRQDKKFSSDGWQGGLYTNTGRKHEDDWSKSKNDKSRKLSDGWENNGSTNRTKDTRGRIISDGWEKEENCGKANETLQRPSDEVDRDDSFSNSCYEHKQKRFSNQRAKSSSFRGKSSRVYSSSEREKSHFDSRQSENWNPWPVSDDNQQFRRKEGRTAIDDVESQNFDRRWQNEGFDHKGGGNRFWEDKRRGSDTRRISRGHGSRGNGKNAFRTNKNTEFQEYHNKNTYNNSQTSDTFKFVDGVKNKKQISNDHWECEYDELQASSENWLEDNKKILDDTWKSATIVNTTENILSQDSSEPDMQKQKVSADTESHDDSWEDVTSGCESELSDQNEGIPQTDNHALFAESKFHSFSFDKDLSKDDNKLNTIQYRPETNSKHHSSNTKVMEESDEHQDVKINDLGFCKDSTDTFSGVTSEISFSFSRNDSVERILEEVYNDAINSEKNKYIDTQTKSNEEVSDVYQAGIISNTGCKTSENGIYDDCLIDSLDNTKNDITEEPLQSSTGIHYVDININNEDGVIANNNEDNSSGNSYLNSCVHSDDKNTDSCTYEPTGVLSLDNNSRDSICQDNCIQPDFSSTSVSNATICESNSDTTLAHSVKTDDCINKLSFMIPSVNSVQESVNSNEVIKASMKKASNQTKVNLSTEVQQICDLTAVEDKNTRGFAYDTSDLEDSAMSESADRKETSAEIESSENVVTKDILSSSIKSKEVEDSSTDNVTGEPSIIVNTVEKDSNCYEEQHQVCCESTKISVIHNKLDSDTDMQQLHETPKTEINNTSVYDSVPSESRQNDLEQDMEVSSLPVECTSADKNNTSGLNICTISAMKMIETSNKDSKELHEKILEPSEASNKDKEIDPSTEMQKIHKIAIVIPSDKHSNDQEGLIIQDKDKINSYVEIVSAYEDSVTSDDNIVSLDVIDKVKDDDNINEPSISIVKSAEAISNSHKEFTHTFSDEKKVDLHMEEQHMYTATEAQINEESSCQKLLELMPHKNNSNSVSTPENSVTFKTTESREVVVTPSTYPEHTLGNDITSLNSHNKLEQSTKNRECNDIDVSSDSNNAVSSNDLLSVDITADIKEKIVTDSEQIKEVSSATSMNSETTEQILTNVVSSLDNGNENALHNFTPNVLNIKDPLARTVRKCSATECTTEFAEVLEVTTSIPQRTVLQDIDSAHSINKVECEQITSSLNLHVKPPENLIAE